MTIGPLGHGLFGHVRILFRHGGITTLPRFGTKPKPFRARANF